MDWHTWLSRSNLEPSLANEFGLVFRRNELQKEDMMYFNHEFLQSLGISVAKHRLEILSLVNKDLGRTRTLLKALKVGIVISAFKKTKKFFTEWGSYSYKKNDHSRKLRRVNSAREQHKAEKSIPTMSRTVAKSGPIDTRRMMMTDKWNTSLSGPLDMKFYQDKKLRLQEATRHDKNRHATCDGKWRKTFEEVVEGNKNNLSKFRPWQGRSPSPLFDYTHRGNNNPEYYSPWSMMFQDLKPT